VGTLERAIAFAQRLEVPPGNLFEERQPFFQRVRGYAAAACLVPRLEEGLEHLMKELTAFLRTQA
jgi:hypothetical protein